MKKFENAKKLGLRNLETEELVAVYPNKADGTDEEIEKTVKDWYYQQACGAEDQLKNLFVDELTDEEIKSWNV
ncbi:MAG: hypothetical protein HGA49_03425 [Eubacteriaceae bacterium]|nr:hypothetical protein [Eubacteriaceae bacterium]